MMTLGDLTKRRMKKRRTTTEAGATGGKSHSTAGPMASAFAACQCRDWWVSSILIY